MAERGTVAFCSGCGAHVADIEGPMHAYMLSAPGCWQLYGEVLASEFSDPAQWPVHQLSVDSYAVQHPSNPDRRNCQSVAVHLISLCLLLERGVPAERAPQLRAAHIQRHRASGFAPLKPSPPHGAVTVADVAGAPTPAEHIERVHRWANSAWQSWTTHHDQIRAWSTEVPLSP